MLIEIYADNLTKKDISKNFHRSARGILLKEGKLLLLHSKKLDYYMLPGGGIEKNELETSCIQREMLEETGIEVEVEKKTVTVKEYFPNGSFEANYYFVKYLNQDLSKMTLTEEEKDLDIEQLWFDIDEALTLLDTHESDFKYAYNIMQREFIALINSL
jgi:8-oxo-dGTP pyrophosphatase MutT (NUDIX family)